MNHPLAVGVVDDDDAVRDGLLSLLASDGLEARGFESAESFLRDARPESLGCLVLDVRMPGMDGFELQRRLVEREVDLPIVFLTGHGDVSMSSAAFRAGAIDFLEKPVDGDVLLARVHEALGNATQARAAREERVRRAERIRGLTRREREVLAKVAAGSSSKEIARALGVSHRTVEAHRARIMAKTGATSLAALVEIALECGLVVRNG